MKRNTKGKAKQKSKKSLQSSTAPVSPNSPNTVTNTPQAMNKSHDSGQNNQTDKKLLKLQEKQTNEQNRANRIAIIASRLARKAVKQSRIANVINAALIIFTALMFAYNIKGINAAVQSANAADSSLTENRKQFEAINKPYLQIDSCRFNYNTRTKRIILQIGLANLGQYPSQLMYYQTAFTTNQIDNPVKWKDTVALSQPIVAEVYIIKENARPVYLEIPPEVIRPVFDQVFKGDKWVYMYCKMTYQNLVTEKNRVYDMVMGFFVNPLGLTTRVFFFNKNYDAD